MARKRKTAPIDLPPEHVLMAPGNQVFIDSMQSVAHDIWMETTGPNCNWYFVELKAAELAKMCEIRRVRRS